MGRADGGLAARLAAGRGVLFAVRRLLRLVADRRGEGIAASTRPPPAPPLPLQCPIPISDGSTHYRGRRRDRAARAFFPHHGFAGRPAIRARIRLACYRAGTDRRNLGFAAKTVSVWRLRRQAPRGFVRVPLRLYAATAAGRRADTGLA